MLCLALALLNEGVAQQFVSLVREVGCVGTVSPEPGVKHEESVIE